MVEEDLVRPLLPSAEERHSIVPGMEDHKEDHHPLLAVIHGKEIHTMPRPKMEARTLKRGDSHYHQVCEGLFHHPWYQAHHPSEL